MRPLKITITQGDETDVWIAVEESIGLAIEADTLDALLDRLKIVIPELMEANMTRKTGKKAE
jgi:hypothetical protein